MDASLLQIYLALLITGVLLVGAEIYVPGGIVGVLGALALLGAVVVGFFFGPGFGVISAVAIVILSSVGLYFWIHYFPRTSTGRKLALQEDGRLNKNDGPELQALIGLEGVAQSALRPSGVAIVGGRRLDVITAGVWIEPGTPVRVTAVQGHRIEVSAIVPAASPGEPPA